MDLIVNGQKAYCYTGGKALDSAKPTVVFIHGVLNDHSSWALQSRYFANHGWNVLAVDLPGQSRSGGEPVRSVEQAAQFVIALLDAAGVQQAALVGHSFGSLTAMEASARAPQRISKLVMVGTAYPMRVSPALLDTSLNEISDLGVRTPSSSRLTSSSAHVASSAARRTSSRRVARQASRTAPPVSQV